MSDNVSALQASPIKHAVPFFSTQGKFEHIPKWLNLFPMVAQWLWLSLKYGSVSLPSAANPLITSGGMVGDGKMEYFSIMGPAARAVTADYIGVRAGNNFSLDGTLAHMQASGLHFPIVAKPDLGWCGYGVRLVHGEQELSDYARNYPAGETFLLQRFIEDEGEAGIFYVREPGESTGRIHGILLRFYPKIIGDGKRTVAELISANERLQRLTGNALHQPNFDPDHVPETGEAVRLSLIGSTRVGGLYVDGTDHARAGLIEKIDAVAKDMGEFYIGRFDVRYQTLPDLENGDFTIMEVNGAGSEAVHAWDPKYTIPQVYKMVFAKQRLLFAVSDAMRKRGHKPIGLAELARLHFRQQRLMRRYPLSN